MSFRLKIFVSITLIFLFADISIAKGRCYSHSNCWGDGNCGGCSEFRTCYGSGTSTAVVCNMRWCDNAKVQCVFVIKNGKIISSEGTISEKEKKIMQVIIEIQNSLLKKNILSVSELDKSQRQYSEKIKKIYGDNCTVTSEPSEECFEIDENKISKEIKSKLQTVIDKKMKEVKKDVKKDNK